MAGTEVKVPDIGDFKEVEVIEVLVKPGDTVAKEQSLITLESDKATMEIPSPAAGKVTQLKRQGRRQGVEGLADPAARRRSREGGSAGAGAESPRSIQAGSADALDRRGHRMRRGGARRGARRLFGGVPRRRPRHEDGAGRALSDARRRVPERRLHPVQGAAAHRGDHGRRARARVARHLVRRAEGRPRQAARVQGQGGRQADRRPRRHGEDAQGHGGARASAAFLDKNQLRGRTARPSASTPRSSPRARRRRSCRSCPTTRASSIRPARSS